MFSMHSFSLPVKWCILSQHRLRFLGCNYSRILIKSSLPYFAKVRTLSGRGLYQDWPFYDLVCMCEMGLFNQTKASCIAFDLAMSILIHQSSQLTIFQILVSYNTVSLKKKNHHAEMHPILCVVYSTLGSIQPLLAFSCYTAQYLSWYHSLD